MVLNYIWAFFLIIAFVVATLRLVILGDTVVFSNMLDSTFSSARTAFEISLGLTGVLSLWLGVMKIGEKGGVIGLLSRKLSPLFIHLFPSIPRNHPVFGSMFMNVAANMLGLDNAATPLGLKSMEQLQELNLNKETASNAMIMFLVLNTSGLTLIPVSIMVYRAQMGASNPADIFLPLLITTFCSTFVGILATCLYQRIRLPSKFVVTLVLGVGTFTALLSWGMSILGRESMEKVCNCVAAIILMSVIVGFVLLAIIRHINVYESFIEGASDGFRTAVRIIPYLVAILVAIGVFRSSGAMELLIGAIRYIFEAMGLNSDFVPALPTALMKPLSGSGARGMMVDAMSTWGADSYIGRLCCLFQGSTDTTFYILSVYFGSIGVRYTRHAVSCGLIADLAGIVSAIFIGNLFFG